MLAHDLGHEGGTICVLVVWADEAVGPEHLDPVASLADPAQVDSAHRIFQALYSVRLIFLRHIAPQYRTNLRSLLLALRQLSLLPRVPLTARFNCTSPVVRLVLCRPLLSIHIVVIYNP